MVTNVLLLAQHGINSFRSWSLGGLLLFGAGVALVALVIICIYRAAEYFGSASKEQKLLRIEMGKPAEEVRQLRQELKDSKHNDSPSQTG